MLVLLIVALWFILRGDLFLSFARCYLVFVFFSPYIYIGTALGREY